MLSAASTDVATARMRRSHFGLGLSRRLQLHTHWVSQWIVLHWRLYILYKKRNKTIKQLVFVFSSTYKFVVDGDGRLDLVDVLFVLVDRCLWHRDSFDCFLNGLFFIVGSWELGLFLSSFIRILVRPWQVISVRIEEDYWLASVCTCHPKLDF